MFLVFLTVFRLNRGLYRAINVVKHLQAFRGRSKGIGMVFLVIFTILVAFLRCIEGLRYLEGFSFLA
jgi:hypothetical protein